MHSERFPRFVWSFLILSAMLTGVCAPAAADSFDSFVNRMMSKYHVDGAVVAIVNDRHTVFVKGYGVRKRGSPVPVDRDTRFPIASVSKFITAAALATVVESGKIGWDTPIVDRIPDFAMADPYVTKYASLRDMLAYRSGLPDHSGDVLERLGYSSDEIFRRVRYLQLDHSFRAYAAYSNYGVLLAQVAGARVAGLDISDLLTKRILEPLHMNDSSPDIAQMQPTSNVASVYLSNGKLSSWEDVDAFAGAGSVVSSGADLAHFVQMLLAHGRYGGRQVLKPQTVDQLFTPSMVQPGLGFVHDPNYADALGCESYHYLRYRVIEKNGALRGVRSIVSLVPEKHIGIVVIANRDLTLFPEAVRAEFLRRQLGDPGFDVQKRIDEEQEVWLMFAKPPTPPPGGAAPLHPIAAMSGRFSSPLYGDLVIMNDGGKLRATLGPNHYPVIFEHWSGDTYLMRFPKGETDLPGLMTFQFDPDGTLKAVVGVPPPRPAMDNFGTFSRS